MPRRVLMVAYSFPPVGGVEVQRTLKYVTYLPRFGWEPVVLTARDPGQAFRTRGSAPLAPPDLVVERSLSPEPVKLRRALGRLLRRLTGRRAAETARGLPGADASPSSPAIPSPRLSKIALALWTRAITLVFFPDQMVGWVPFATRRGLAMLRQQRFDAIYSSSAPLSCHLVAATLARKTGLQWIADFRDPWIGNAFAKPLPFWQRPLQSRIERNVVRQASRIVVVTDGMRDDFRARYPWAHDRFVSIPNGYDRNDFDAEVLAVLAERAKHRESASGRRPARRVADPSRRFKLIYPGTVWGEHELEFFLDGLELLLARRPELRDRLDVEFIGWLNLHNQEVAARHDAPEQLGSVVTYSPFAPRHEVLAREARADAGFHFISEGPGKEVFLSGKLPEYAGLDLQIILFAPEGSARAFLRELNWGITADPTPEGVADGIERLLSTPLPDRVADPQGRYDRVNLTGRLAALMDQAVAERGA